MLREFFCAKKRGLRAWAWLGGLSIAAHAFLKAYIKYLMNDWMGRFYDTGASSRDLSPDDMEGLAEGSRKITRLLVEFAVLCLPSVLIHPMFRFIMNRWALSWRVALINAYLERWALVDLRIENGAQRIHEDTQRFSRGLQVWFSTVLESMLTIGVFAPILIDLGSGVQPRPMSSPWPGSWLFLLCVGIAVTGLGISVALGWSLISLEVDNQRVEADLRRDLVLCEEGTTHPSGAPIARRMSIDDVVGVHEDDGHHTRVSADLKSAFSGVVVALVRNYKKLYCRFAAFSLWLGAYGQFVAILPYLVAGPLLFCPTNRITLGRVTQVANAFGNVFDALNIISDHWIDVTEWLSVMRRLGEFEVHIYAVSTTRVTLLPGVELSSETATQIRA